MDVLIIGAGGHGQTVADALLKIARGGGAMRPIGFLDDTPELQGWRYQDLAVLGRLSEVRQIAHDALIAAIGDNRARRTICLRLQTAGFRFAAVVHPAAAVALDAEIGPGSYVSALALVGTTTQIGTNTIVNGAGCIGHHCVIGDHVHMAPGVNTAASVRVGEGTMIGAGTNIVAGCTIGAWSVVGAGSVVTRDIPDGVIAYGSPARVIRRSSAPIQ